MLSGAVFSGIATLLALVGLVTPWWVKITITTRQLTESDLCFYRGTTDDAVYSSLLDARFCDGIEVCRATCTVLFLLGIASVVVTLLSTIAACVATVTLHHSHHRIYKYSAIASVCLISFVASLYLFCVYFIFEVGFLAAACSSYSFYIYLASIAFMLAAPIPMLLGCDQCLPTVATDEVATILLSRPPDHVDERRSVDRHARHKQFRQPRRQHRFEPIQPH